MLERKRLGFRPGCWFWVAMVALLTNPYVWRLLLNLLLAGVQLVGSHVPLP